MKRDDRSPEHYVESVPEPLKGMLVCIRQIIHERFPDIQEGIQYGMLDYPDLANLAAQKDYVSLYVAPVVLDEFKSRFPKASSEKACLRFRNPSQLDEEGVADLLSAVWQYSREKK